MSAEEDPFVGGAEEDMEEGLIMAPLLVAKLQVGQIGSIIRQEIRRRVSDLNRRQVSPPQIRISWSKLDFIRSKRSHSPRRKRF